MNQRKKFVLDNKGNNDTVSIKGHNQISATCKLFCPLPSQCCKAWMEMSMVFKTERATAVELDDKR